MALLLDKERSPQQKGSRRETPSPGLGRERSSEVNRLILSEPLSIVKITGMAQSKGLRESKSLKPSGEAGDAEVSQGIAITVAIVLQLMNPLGAVRHDSRGDRLAGQGGRLWGSGYAFSHTTVVSDECCSG